MIERKYQQEQEAIQHGKNVEKEAVEEFTKAVPDNWKVMYGLLLPEGGGDVDIFLEIPNRKPISIEVKSYAGSLQFNGGKLTRGDGVDWADVNNQIHNQARQLRSVPVLWRPKAEPKIEKLGNIFAVGGNAQDLITRIENEI